MASIQIFGSTSDGTSGEQQNLIWATVRDASAAGSPTAWSNSVSTCEIAGWNNTSAYTISRAVFVFDLSVIPPALITAITLSLCAANTGGIANGTNNYLVPFGGTLALDNNSYNKTNFGTSFSVNYGTLSSVSLTTDQYYTMNGNATMVTDANTNIHTNFLIGCVTDNDYTNSSPTPNVSAASNFWYMADQSGTGKDPYVTVTYTPLSGGMFMVM